MSADDSAKTAYLAAQASAPNNNGKKKNTAEQTPAAGDLGCSAFGCQPARDGHYYPCAGSDGMCYPYCCSGGATCSTAPCLSDSDLEFLGATGCVPVDCAGCVARAVLCASL